MDSNVYTLQSKTKERLEEMNSVQEIISVNPAGLISKLFSIK